MSRGQVPDTQRAVVAGRNGAPAVASRQHHRDAPFVPRAGIQRRTGGRVPQADGLVGAGGCQGFAIRGESDAHHALGVSPQDMDLFPRVGCEKANGTVIICRGDGLAVWTVCQGEDSSAVEPIAFAVEIRFLGHFDLA